MTDSAVKTKKKTTEKRPFYQKNWLIISLLLFLPPVGTILVFTSQWKNKVKIPVGIIGALWSLIVMMPTDEPVADVEPARPAAEAPVSAPVQPRENPDGVGFNTPVEARGRTIQTTGIYSINNIPGDGFITEDISGNIVVVEFNVANTSREAGDIMFSAFEVIDEKGYSYDEITDLAYSVWREDNGYGSRSDEIFPEYSRNEAAAFLLPPGANPVTMKWSGKKFALR